MIYKQQLHIDEFSAFLSEQGRSLITIQGYVSDMSLFARWYAEQHGEEPTFETLAAPAVRAYKQHLLDRKAKPKTVNRRMAALAAFAAWAYQAGYMKERNPAQGVTVIKPAPLAPRWLDEKQQAALMRTVEDEVEIAIRRYPRLSITSRRDAAIVHLILSTGLRVKEVVELRLSDVLLTERKGTVIVRQGKGGKRREIPLNAQARKTLQDYLNVRPEVETSSFFVGQSNDGIQEKTVQRAVKRFADAAGMGEVSAQMLRYTFAKSLIDKGFPLEKVALLLGHNNLNTTQAYITSFTRE